MSLPATPQTLETIEIRLSAVSRLFNSLDPTPFHERELDAVAAEHIVDWARELPKTAELDIRVHLPESERLAAARADLPTAIANHFGYAADSATGDLRELFRVGRRALAIGAAVLVACIVAGQFASALLPWAAAGKIVSESLLIFGWVANWRPAEIFLYDWWPLTRRRALYRRLAAARIEIVWE